MAASGFATSISKDTAIVIFDSVLIKKFQFKFKLVPFLRNDTAGGLNGWIKTQAGWQIILAH